jgi:hypothetical protein
LGGVAAELREAPVKGRLPTSESDAETAVHIEFVKPAGYTFKI